MFSSSSLHHLQYPLKHSDAVHELLLSLGDMTRTELAARCVQDAVRSDATEGLDSWLEDLVSSRRILQVQIAGQQRYIAAEDAGRFRDALGIVPPAGIPAAFLEPLSDPLVDLVSRYARTHTPFKADEIAARFALGVAPVLAALKRLAESDRVLEGEFLPGGRGREWCDAEVLRTLKRRSLARLRKQVEPVETAAWGRFLAHWQGLTRPRRGLDGLLDVIQQLQGAALPASVLEREILAVRLQGYQPSDLDELCTAGEVVWRGLESVGANDGRIALFLTDHAAHLSPPPSETDDELELQIVELLQQRGALFFEAIHSQLERFKHDVLDALWRLTWAGHVTNDTLAPLRSLTRRSQKTKHQRRRGQFGFRSRRSERLPGSEGRWSLFLPKNGPLITTTERQTAIATQLVERYGVVTREIVSAEGVSGGFAGLYPVLKAMEETGRVRRGYFIAGQGAAQFAAPGCEDQLREPLAEEVDAEVLILSATDPANLYGAGLRWPTVEENAARPQRIAGARVLLYQGILAGYLSRTNKQLLTFLVDTEPERSKSRAAIVEALAAAASSREPISIERIDADAAGDSQMHDPLVRAGFVPHGTGLVHRG